MPEPNQGAPGHRRASFPIGAIIALGAPAVIALGLAAYALFGLPEAGPASPTTVAIGPTAVFLPTVTPSLTALPTSTTEPSDTPAPAAPTVDATVLTVNAGINVRGGPGTNYPIVGGLNPGETARAIGRDSSSAWFAISLAGGQGWVAAQFVTYPGLINDLPILAAPPPPAAPPTSPPTAVPPTSPPAGYFSRGVQGVSFSVENTTAIVGQDVWFNFKVVNTTDAPVAYSVLAARAESGQNAQSWTNEVLQPHGVLPWRDHINFTAPGTYKLYLGICYGGREACLANAAPWDRLSASITVVIQ